MCRPKLYIPCMAMDVYQNIHHCISRKTLKEATSDIMACGQILKLAIVAFVLTTSIFMGEFAISRLILPKYMSNLRSCKIY